jgi:hypothetical protein
MWVRFYDNAIDLSPPHIILTLKNDYQEYVLNHTINNQSSLHYTILF